MKMMYKDNEWQELDITNLPSGNLVKDYEWKCYNPEWDNNHYEGCEIRLLHITFGNIECNGYKYRYRKLEPKGPTHKEIMTLWWNLNGYLWLKVVEYDPTHKKYYAGDVWYHKEYFEGKESAEVPNA